MVVIQVNIIQNNSNICEAARFSYQDTTVNLLIQNEKHLY